MNHPNHLYPEHPAQQPDAAKMWFQVLPRNKNAIVELSAVEDTLAFAAFPAFHRKVFDAAWQTLYGIPCTQAIFEHYRNHPEIQKQCLHRIETKTLKNGASLAEALLTVMRWECNPAQLKLLEQAVDAFKQEASDSSPTSFDAEPEVTS